MSHRVMFSVQLWTGFSEQAINLYKNEHHASKNNNSPLSLSKNTN